MIEGLRGAHRAFRESRGLRRGIRIKRGSLDVSAPWPKPHAAHLMRIRFTRNGVRPFALRRAPAGKSRHCQIETAPEKVDRTRFSDKLRAEFAEHRITTHESTPESIRILWIVRSMLDIPIERDRIGDLDRHLPDLHGNSQRSECCQELPVKI